MAGSDATGHPDRRRRLRRPDGGARDEAERAGACDRDRRREGAGRGQARRARLGDRRGGAAHARAARRLVGGRAEAQPILSMEITDSRTGDAVRPIFLTFDGHVERGRAVRAHGAERAAACGASRRGASRPAIVLTAPDSVERFAADGGMSRSGSPQARRGSASLLVAADGIRSRLRALAGIKTVTLALSADGARRDRRARAAAQRRRGRAFPAERAVRHPAAQGQPLVARLDGARRRKPRSS